GEETDTLDLEGEVVATSPHHPPLAAVAAVCAHFTGEIEQVPPAYPALKVDGKRAYDRARAGEEGAREPHKAASHSLALLGHGGETGDDASDGAEIYSTFAVRAGRPDGLDPAAAAPLELAERVTLVAEVSKGTYVRSLARDIAHALGTVGHVTYLR